MSSCFAGTPSALTVALLGELTRHVGRMDVAFAVAAVLLGLAQAGRERVVSKGWGGCKRLLTPVRIVAGSHPKAACGPCRAWWPMASWTFSGACLGECRGCMLYLQAGEGRSLRWKSESKDMSRAFMHLDCGMPRVYEVALSFGGFAGPVFTCARLRASMCAYVRRHAGERPRYAKALPEA